MSHPDEGVLQELLDGELPAADAAAVRAHLAGCVPCAVILRDLGATQAEADAIVARLPLDPPLVRPASRTRPRRAMNLRAIGLAASVVLVAGTSWLLLRSPGDAYLRGSKDSSAGRALPMPGEERQEVPATTPVVPPPAALAPAAGARTERSDDQREKAKQAPQEADAPAAPPAAKDLASQAVQQPGKEAEKKEAADEARRANEARPAGAPAPIARVAPPAAAARLTLGAAKAPDGTPITVADAEARMGTRLRTISGLTPISVEMLPVAADSLLAVRQRYVVDGVAVTLVQQSTRPVAGEAAGSKARDAVPYVDGVAVQPGNRGNGFVASESGGARPASRAWAAWGSLFLLRGDLPADSIDALMKRVK